MSRKRRWRGGGRHHLRRPAVSDLRREAPAVGLHPESVDSRSHPARAPAARGRCIRCGRTHVILPDRALLCRLDRVEVIGAGLMAHAEGASFRTISGALSVPATTVRDWIRRFVARAATNSRPAATAPAPREGPATASASLLQRLLSDLVTPDSPAPGGPGAPWRQANRETQGRLLV